MQMAFHQSLGAAPMATPPSRRMLTKQDNHVAIMRAEWAPSF